MTPKQEKFIQNLIKGMSQREAYKNAYDAKNMKDETIDCKASLLLKKDKVRARYDELIKKAEDEAIMSAIERKKWLSKIVNGNEAYISDKMKAIDILNKMDGSYTAKFEGNMDVQIEVGIDED